MASFPEFPANGHAFSADETGEALAGLIRRDAAGMPVPGMLAVPKVTAVAAAWKVEVGPFAYVRRIGAAVGISGLSAAEQKDVTSSATIPAGQARIDRVCWDAVDSTLVVVPGTPGTSPVAPSDGGLVRVAQVRVNAGDGAVVQGQITPDYAVTGLAGGGRVDQGLVAKRSIHAGGSVEVNVTFPVGMFTEPPVVMVTVWDVVRDVNAGVISVTKDGCVISLGSNSVVPRTFGAMWRAEQL